MTVNSTWLDEIFFLSLHYSSVVYRYLSIDLKKKMHGRDAVCNTMLNLIVTLDLHKSKDSHLSERKLFPPILKLISVGPLSVVCILRVISSELDGKFPIFKSPSSLAQASVFFFLNLALQATVIVG